MTLSASQIGESVNLPIIDAHHHLWPKGPMGPAYLLPDLLDDLGTVPDVRKTVYIECGMNYRSGGPDLFRPVGEIEHIVELTKRQSDAGITPPIEAVVGHADLTAGRRIYQVVETQLLAGEGMLRGIRHAGADDPQIDLPFGPCPYPDARFRQAVGMLGRNNLIYETWHFHPQNDALAELAEAVSETTIVLDHLGCPLGVHRFDGEQERVFDEWCASIERLAQCDNVFLKLSGLSMRFTGLGWHASNHPPEVDEIAQKFSRYFLHAIDCFGSRRCMFGSNFPVDRLQFSYETLWRAYRQCVAHLPAHERHDLLHDTASRVYGL